MFALISVGKDNNYNLSNSLVLSILKQKDITIKRTDLGKDVEFVIDKDIILSE